MSTEVDRQPRNERSSGVADGPALLEALFHAALDVPAARRAEWIESERARGLPSATLERAAALVARVEGDAAAWYRGANPALNSAPISARAAIAFALGVSAACAAAGQGVTMRHAVLATTVSIAASSFASTAGAQDAVQWRVEDGGNGHWYRYMYFPDGTGKWFLEAQADASSKGGHLATATSTAENEWLKANVVMPNPTPTIWGPGLGARREGATWTWVTGEPWAFTAWGGVEPTGDGPNLQYWRYGALWWNDTPDGPGDKWIYEWSADCNGDGIVDYGQIRDGTLVDADGGNVPDCCEQGFDCRFTASEWHVGDGGNGHWYAVGQAVARWPEQATGAQMLGGALASITSEEEQAFIDARMPALVVWIGARRSPIDHSDFEWIDGSSWKFSHFRPGEPSGCNPCGASDYVSHEARSGGWDDTGYLVNGDPSHPGFRGLIEWSADCNGDGIVDYGQLRAGELSDVNENFIPDCCENGIGIGCACPGDVDGDGEVDSVDLSIVLDAWGSAGDKQFPRSDTNDDGTVDGADLSAVLFGWGACPG